MATDPQARQAAHSSLMSMFQGLGQHAGADGGAGGGQGGSPLGGLAGQFTEFLEMPVELAQTFLNYATQLTELTLQTLEEAGLELVKGLTPA